MTDKAPARIRAFDSHVEVANRWMKELIRALDLAPGQQPHALQAMRAGLHAIRDRLPAHEVVDLGAQLPTLIRGFYYEGWTLQKEPHRIRDREALLACIKRELPPNLHLAPIAVLRAVIQVVVAHVSHGEIEDVLATLPKPIAALWQELATPVHVSVQASQRRQGLTRRTGYSR